jgi:hypothetical protein
MYYEVIYETGAHSIASYDDDEQALSALNAHQERAKAGLPALAGSDVPAERIARVLVYDHHPADYNLGQQVPAQDLANTLANMTDADGLVNVPEVAAAVRNSTSPFVAQEGAHDSSYAMPSSRELSWTN